MFLEFLLPGKPQHLELSFVFEATVKKNSRANWSAALGGNGLKRFQRGDFFFFVALGRKLRVCLQFTKLEGQALKNDFD